MSIKYLRQLLIIILWLGGASLAKAEQTSKTWEFLTPTSTHNSESPDKPGKGWLALRNNGNSWMLENTTVTAQKIPSDITDYDVQITGKHADAIAFLRSSIASQGPVSIPPTFDYSKPIPFDHNMAAPLNIRFNNLDYIFHVESVKPYTYPSVTVKQGKRLSRIGTASHPDIEDYVAVVWTGDIDRDGLLDLIVREVGANYSGFCLYLTSRAKGTELFGAPLCHIGSGC